MNRSILTASVALLLCACGPEPNQVEPEGSETGPFAVSRYFVPSGAMGDGAQGLVSTEEDTDCKERPEGAEGKCYKFTWTIGDSRWAGVYWQHPTNNWGSEPGKAIDSAQYHQVTFSAASDTDGQAVEFIVGGIQDVTLPYADTFRASLDTVLTPDWQTFSIDLTGQTYTEVLGGFAWSASVPASTDPTTAPPVVLYVDDVVWQ